MDSFSIQNSFRIQPRPVCRSTGRSTDPSSRSTVPVDRAQPRLMPFQSVDWRSTGSFCGRPGDRPLQPVPVGAQRLTGLVDRATAAADSLLLLMIPCLVFNDFFDFLSLPTILHLGEDSSNLSRTETYKPSTRKWLHQCSCLRTLPKGSSFP